MENPYSGDRSTVFRFATVRGYSGILQERRFSSQGDNEDFYRPMRETQSQCQRTHNNLFLKYEEVAGSYQLMLDEFKHLTTTDVSKITKEYQVLLESVLSTHTVTNAGARELEDELELCRAKLFQQYGELALVTGTYKKFIKFATDRASRINSLYAERKSLAEKTLKSYDAKEFMGMLRNFFQSNFDSQEEKTIVTQKINELGKSIIQYYLQLSENEQEMFKVDVKFFEDLHDIFSTEISDRFERGFIARHFF